MSAPERFASWLGATIRENFKAVLGVAGLLWLAVMFDLVTLPNVSIPLWARVLGTFGAISAGGGYLLASMHFDEPEPDWNRLVEVNLDREQWIRETKVSDAVLADLTVVGGRLKSPPGSDLYACRYFNRDEQNPVAHVTWKDVPSDAELLGVRPSSIEDEVASLRDSYEDTHGKYQWVLDHLYMVIRRLDFRRTESQNAVLEEHVTPSMADESLADVVDDVLPEEVQPDRFETEFEDDRTGEAVDELADDLDETEVGGIGSEPTAAADGGQPDE